MDYLLYVDQQAVGVVESKREGVTLTGVEVQSSRYAAGLPSELSAALRPLPFRLRDESLEVSENLPDPDVIAQEILEDLRAAVEQFEEVANDLARGRTRVGRASGPTSTLDHPLAEILTRRSERRNARTHQATVQNLEHRLRRAADRAGPWRLHPESSARVDAPTAASLSASGWNSMQTTSRREPSARRARKPRSCDRSASATGPERGIWPDGIQKRISPSRLAVTDGDAAAPHGSGSALEYARPTEWTSRPPWPRARSSAQR